MKKYIILIFLFIGSSVMMSCEKDFAKINTNPNASTVASSNYLFSNALLNTFNNDYFYTEVLNCGGFVQHYATYKEVSGVGDKYFANDAYQAPFFSDAYPNSINQVMDVIRNTSSPDDINKNSIARIWKVFIMHRITDLYGNVPYSEAGKGYPDLIFTPKYDTQSAIYSNMLSELETASAALNAQKGGFGAADLIYGGDVAKWKKLANSLMLRLGMRLSKIDPANAKTWVNKAIAGGVIVNADDNAIIKYTDGPQNYNRNPASYESRTRDFVPNSFGRTNIEGGKFSKTFIDYLTKTNDPRLNVISGVWVNKVQVTATNVQKGFPNGIGTAATPSADALATYSEPNQNTIFKMDAPMLVIGNAETNLLMAEAALRGWTSGSASTLFESAVKASLANYSIFGASAVIPSDKVSAFVASKTLTGSDEAKMEQIHNEFWVSLFINEIEVYSNWRRTGYPKLTPVNYPGNSSAGTIPRRFIYPNLESAVNSANYKEAIAAQGPDVFTTRIWWDKN